MPRNRRTGNLGRKGMGKNTRFRRQARGLRGRHKTRPLRLPPDLQKLVRRRKRKNG